MDLCSTNIELQVKKVMTSEQFCEIHPRDLDDVVIPMCEVYLTSSYGYDNVSCSLQ